MFKSVSTRVANENDKHLPAFDNTKLTAINTCPRWGLIRYHLHKTVKAPGRSMALEAGSACHEFFAAVRCYQLGWVQGHMDHAEYNGIRMFGEASWEAMKDHLTSGHQYRVGDWRPECLNFCLQALYNSGFYDDPRDNRRTMTNLEEACLAYFNKWQFEAHKVFVTDLDDVTKYVGVENAFDIVIEFELDDGTVQQYRFTGKIDGTHVHEVRKQEVIKLHENKTASRINDAWRQSFDTSSQVTGYCVALSTMLNQPIFDAEVYGLAIPQPRNGVDACVKVPVYRSEQMVEEWFKWFWHTTRVFEQFKDDILEAPMFTHSCNRYFQPCMFIPFCTADKEQQRESLEHEMETDEWSPLH